MKQNLQSHPQTLHKLSNEVELGILEAEGNLNRKIQASLNEFRTKLNQKLYERMNIHDDHQNSYDTAKSGPEKRFKFRESLLSIMFNIQDFKTIYNMAIASFAVLAFNLLYDNYTRTGQFIDTKEFTQVFKGGERVFLYWWVMAACHFSILLVTKIALQIPNLYLIWIPLYLFQQACVLYIAINTCTSHQLGFGAVMIMMTESVRMMMKSHSYFRTKMLYCTDNQYKNFAIGGIAVNTGQQKSLKIHIKMEDIFTEIKRLSYFFVAPTLIYRDQYVLTPIRSTRKMMANFINFIFCIYYAFMLYVMQCKETIRTLERKMDVATFILTIIKLMLPSVLFLILGFFGFLHCWLNTWAEITRFSDRAFYSDWWNSIEFGTYYRKWNIIVHDWLYCYVYIDLCRFSKTCKKHKVIPKLSTFLLSALFHEMIICIAIGFFFPILFILFTGPGIILIQNQSKLKAISINLMFWIEMYIGTAMLFSFYLVEEFARRQVPDSIVIAEWGTAAPLIPRSLYLGQSV